MLEIPHIIKQDGIIIKPIPENVGRNRSFLERCCKLLMNVPYCMVLQGSTELVTNAEELPAIVLQDYRRRVAGERAVERAIRLNSRRQAEVVGYVMELHAQKEDSGLCTYFTRGCRSAGDFRCWITPRVICEVKEDPDFTVPLD